MRKTYLIIALIGFICINANAQTIDTPLTTYKWKGKKTELEAGYVILKSGKKLEGLISLKGSTTGVSEVYFEGDGKKIDFPPSALKAYGLIRKAAPVKKKAVAVGPINDSPESMYEWRDMGVVMNKVITATKPRDGYVVLKNGTKVSGMLKLKRKDGILTNYEVKGSSGKRKGEVTEIANYGYNMSEETVLQANLESKANDFSKGTVKGEEGEISQINVQGKFYSQNIIFKNNSGQLTEYSTDNLEGFTQSIDGIQSKFIAVEGAFVTEEFNGNVFKLYRNPFPTTVNQFASSLAKQSVAMATNAAAQAIVNKDASDNDYVTNMDSVIAVSSKEELIELRDNLVKIGGYSSPEELQENSSNESLKNNVSALDLAIAGMEVQETEGGILNKEWIILNKSNGEKTVVYKSEYKNIIEPLLKGCYDYLSMDKSDQKSYEKWNNLSETVKLLDGCY